MRIGLDGFRAILHHPWLADLPGIIETPGESLELDRRNMETLKALP